MTQFHFTALFSILSLSGFFGLVGLPVAQAAAPTPYVCSTEFGETVPLRKIVLKEKENCPNCGEFKTEIPFKSIDTELSKDWNIKVLKSTAKDAGTPKRHSYKVGDRSIYIDTRYMKQRGPKFEFSMSCDKNEKCKGAFKNNKEGKVTLKPTGPLFDQRIPDALVEMTVELATREQFGLIVRLMKDKIPLKDGSTLPVSGSGEIKFFVEDERYIHDTGVDEHLNVLENIYLRIAAIEVKLRCQIKDE